MEQTARIETLLCTGDEALASAVAAAGAAVRRPVTRVAGLEALAGAWREGRVVVVGADVAVPAARMALPTRDGVYVLGDARAPAAALSASVRLGAGTIVLPEGAELLVDVLAGRTGGARAASRIAVLGGSGGVGASTVAVGLATAGTVLGASALVDLDPWGGGLDLLLGAERVPGWRWDRLKSARGQIGDLRRELPSVTGVSMVSMSRDDATGVTRDAVAAVVSALARSHAVVVLDVGRCLDAASREALRSSDRTVVVVAQDVRGVAAARMTLDAAQPSGAGVVVRLRRGGTIRPSDVAAALGLPLLGTVPHAASLPAAAERGVAPDRAAGRRWTRSCATVLREVGAHVP